MNTTDTAIEEIKQEKEKTTKSKFFNVMLLAFKIVTKTFKISAKMTKLALAGVSLAAYSYVYSWKFALILMLQLLIHEYGHIWAMKKVGIKTRGIYFIPFVGGAAVAEEDFKTRRDEVFVAIMGPIFGFACALSMLITYYVTDMPLFAAAASWMAMLNLFNLLPINPLDGGRIMKSIAFSLHSYIGIAFLIVGILGGIALAIYAHIWIFILVIILSSLELLVEFYFMRRRKKDEEEYERLITRYHEIMEKHNLTEEQKQQIMNDHPLPELVKIPVKPVMNTKEIIYSALGFFALAIILYLFMAATAHIPGASIAKELLD